MTQSFIDCNIWEIDMYSKMGVEYNLYSLTNIFYYNSLEDKTFDKSSSNMRKKPRIYMLSFQIPEMIIKGIDNKWIIQDKNHPLYGYETIKNFVLTNKKILIKNKCHIIKRKVINMKEEWSVDLNMLFYNTNKDWKNEF
jgi:hypothetical protein